MSLQLKDNHRLVKIKPDCISGNLANSSYSVKFPLTINERITSNVTLKERYNVSIIENKPELNSTDFIIAQLEEFCHRTERTITYNGNSIDFLVGEDFNIKLESAVYEISEISPKSYLIDVSYSGNILHIEGDDYLISDQLEISFENQHFPVHDYLSTTLKDITLIVEIEKRRITTSRFNMHKYHKRSINYVGLKENRVKLNIDQSTQCFYMQNDDNISMIK